MSIYSYLDLTAQEQTYSFQPKRKSIAFALETNYSAIIADRVCWTQKNKKWKQFAKRASQIVGLWAYQNQLKAPYPCCQGEIGGPGAGNLLFPLSLDNPKLPMPRRPLKTTNFDGHTLVGNSKRQKPIIAYSNNNKEKLNWRCVNLLLRLMGMFFVAG